MVIVGIDLSGPSNTSDTARNDLLEWLEQQGLKNASEIDKPTDHYVAACSAALAAWKWKKGESVWLHLADPPFHPFDYVC